MSAAESHRPFFSIVVPTYDRPDRLADCIRSLADLRYDPARFEVIVVDDGSRDAARVREILSGASGRLDVKLLEQDHRGPAAARNRGARQAAGRFLAFTDDDCRPDPDWLDALADHLAASPASIAGGRTVNALRNDVCAEASQALVSYLYAYYERKGTPFVASNNLALSRERFDELAGFDETFSLAGGEDRDFCDRALQRDIPIRLVPRAVVRHHHALSLGGFVRQHLNYGRGAHVFHRRRAARNGGPVEVEPPRFYLDLVRYPLTSPDVRHRLRAGLLMVVSQAANTAGFFREKLRRGGSGG